MIEDSEQLVNSGRAHEYVHKEEVVVFWNDYHRVSGPNESCCCQGSTLSDAEFVRGSCEIGDSGSDEAPFHRRSPRKQFSVRRDVPTAHVVFPGNKLVYSTNYASVQRRRHFTKLIFKQIETTQL